MPYILKADRLETQANKVTKLDENVTDSQYPSAKAVNDTVKKYKEEIDEALNSAIAHRTVVQLKIWGEDD